MPQGALKSSLLLMGTLGLAEVPEATTPQPATLSFRSAPQTAGMVLVLRRWAAAWAEGDAEAMLACLHPALAKHILGPEAAPDARALRHLVGVQSLLGKAVQDRDPEAAVRVLDVQGRSGSARVDLGPWTAFIHLAAHRHQWAIANVLWEWRR